MADLDRRFLALLFGGAAALSLLRHLVSYYRVHEEDRKLDVPRVIALSLAIVGMTIMGLASSP